MKVNSHETVHVNEQNQITILCNQCGNFKTIDTDFYKLIDEPLTIKITCNKCGHNFKIFINFRKTYRKATNLSGICYPISRTGPRNTIDYMRISKITVENISRTGMGFTLKSPIYIQLEDILEVKITLDNKKRTKITKQVIVRRISNNSIGAEFTTPVDERYKDLAFYLIP
ncbi:MAG: PilZ domain-containing protein [Deltaproteobacteria bacterium]|nr:PilZ domain-containing protein [Deltaproteobacteria bacterium]